MAKDITLKLLAQKVKYGESSYSYFCRIMRGAANAPVQRAKAIASELGDESKWPLWADGAGTDEASRERLRAWNIYRTNELRKMRLAEFDVAKKNLEKVL